MKAFKVIIPWWRRNSWEATLGVFCLLAVIISSNLSPYYLNAEQILYSLQQSMSIASTLALGFMLLIIVGEMDISLPGVLALGAVLLGKFSSLGFSYGVSLLLVFLITTLLGALNGFLIVHFNLPSMAVTLGMVGIHRAIALWIGGVEGFSRKVFKPSYLWLGGAHLGIVPMVMLLLAGLFVVGYLLVHRSVYGRLLFAVGNNRKATHFCGHNVKRVIISAFAISGFMAGIGAMLFVGQYQSARSDNASSILLFVVSCVALGGFDLAGGKGHIVGLVLSIFLLGTIQNGMGLANISGPIQTLVVGMILIVAILVPAIVRKFHAMRESIGRSRRNKIVSSLAQ